MLGISSAEEFLVLVFLIVCVKLAIFFLIVRPRKVTPVCRRGSEVLRIMIGLYLDFCICLWSILCMY